MELVHYSNNINEYEFPTLREMQRLSRLFDFNALYMHTKGVSYPSPFVGKTWRRYMMHYLVDNWKECLKWLRYYELVGVKYLKSNDRYSSHFSGNFFWCRSKYIKDLQIIDNLDHDNRFDAEFWVCSMKHRVKVLSDQKIHNYSNYFYDYGGNKIL